MSSALRRAVLVAVAGLVFLVIAAFLTEMSWSTPKGWRVVDGDTVSIQAELKEIPESHRLYGIDAPERRQDYGVNAAMILAHILDAGPWEARPVAKKDRYGRGISLLVLGNGTTAQEEMVRLGAAWVYRNYCPQTSDFCEKLIERETEARRERRGLWASENATPPWEWRRQ